MKISVIATVLNEEQSIADLLGSLFSQTKKPNEIIIVDGGSGDETVELIKEFKQKYDKQSIIRMIETKGTNRPEGRNRGIGAASADIIAITDAGCVLDKKWLEEIVAPFRNQRIDVVSGYYKAKSSSVFERCMGIYTLVMPDKVDPQQFLPSARSMAVRKHVWRQAGGFPENFPFNEDYVFAHTLKRYGKTFHFTKKAVVYWQPRENLKKAFSMFYYFAKGDVQAKLFRPNVFLLLVRYMFGLALVLYAFQRPYAWFLVSVLLCLYILWSILKNYKYVRNVKAVFFLPLLQFTADIAVMLGTIAGFIHGLTTKE